MRRGSTVRRALGFVVRNWPLKLAALAVATLLYAGLVVSQDSAVYPGPIPVKAINQPTGTVVINDLRDVEQVRYIAPADAGRLTADDFRATVDLSNVEPTGEPTAVRVDVVPVDPRVTILEVRPRSIQVILDASVSLVVPVRVERGPTPNGLDVGETRVVPETVTVIGPSSIVRRVVAARATVTLDPSGLDVDRDVEPDPVDAANEVVTGVDVEPRTVHVTIPVFTDRETRTLPVNPILNGAPAPGFRIASVSVAPLTVSVEGDGADLQALLWADTEPVAVFGATSDVQSTVDLALAPGVVPLGAGRVRVVVTIEPVTETRSFGAGIRLDGQDPNLDYDYSGDRVILTLFGPVADLDRLASAPLTVGVNVAALGPGKHDLPVAPSVPTGITVVDVQPPLVTITITERPTPSPSIVPSAEPSPSAGPTETPSPEP